MTPTQKNALALLLRAEAEGHDPSDNAVHSGFECFWDSGAWIGFRTAYALQRRGLVVVSFDCCDDYGSIVLTGGSTPVAENETATSAPPQEPADDRKG